MLVTYKSEEEAGRQGNCKSNTISTNARWYAGNANRLLLNVYYIHKEGKYRLIILKRMLDRLIGGG